MSAMEMLDSEIENLPGPGVEQTDLVVSRDFPSETGWSMVVSGREVEQEVLDILDAR